MQFHSYSKEFCLYFNFLDGITHEICVDSLLHNNDMTVVARLYKLSGPFFARLLLQPVFCLLKAFIIFYIRLITYYDNTYTK